MWALQKNHAATSDFASLYENKSPAATSSRTDLLRVLAEPDSQKRINAVRQYFADLTKVDAPAAMDAADKIEDTRLRTVARLAVISRMPHANMTTASARRWMERWPDESAQVLAAASDLLIANTHPPTHPPSCDCAECVAVPSKP